MFFSQVDGELVETPMFVVCYEELYADDEGADPDEVVAVRIGSWCAHALFKPTPFTYRLTLPTIRTHWTRTSSG